MVRRPSGVRRRPSVVVVDNFKHLLLCNCLANQSQILCGASLGRGVGKFVHGILVTWPRWLPCPYIYGKNPSKIFFSRTGERFPRNLVCSSETPAHHSLYKWWPWSDLDLFYGKVKFGNLSFSIGKNWKLLIFQNICSLWPETNWKNEHRWVLKSRSFLDLGPMSFTYKI